MTKSDIAQQDRHDFPHGHNVSYSVSWVTFIGTYVPNVGTYSGGTDFDQTRRLNNSLDLAARLWLMFSFGMEREVALRGMEIRHCTRL